MIRLSESSLGDLVLLDDPFVVTSLQIGAPAVRGVMRNRALANGAFDDTRFTGSRAVTIGLRLNTKECGGATIQALIDSLAPYTVPRRRCVLSWSLPGSPELERAMVVRGEGLPVEITAPKYTVLQTQWVAPDGEIVSPSETCQIIDPSGDTEDGRTYDLTFDRVYPPSAGIGDRIITQNGNEDAHWRATIFGPCEDPFLRVNGVTIKLTGLTLNSGSNVQIDTRARTIYRNGDPTQSDYALTNYAVWAWADLMLHPGGNLVRYGADVLGVGSTVQFCWRDSYAA